MAKVKRKSEREKPKTTRYIILLALLAILYMQLETSGPKVLPDLDPEDLPEVTELHPVILTQKNKLVAKTRDMGIRILITDGFRSHEEQTRLYAQGRSSGGQIVTHARAGESLHNYGLAIDFALRTDRGDVIWDMEYDGNRNGKSDWMEVVAVAKDLGFQWGGDWANFPDYPHLQMDFGLSISDLKRGKQPPVDHKDYLEAADQNRGK